MLDIKDDRRTHNLLKLIGNTPMIRILENEYPLCDIRIKLESYNPGGSIKDRVALEIIENAERLGSIFPGMELVEATSGNTGIGIAWIGRLKGYKVTIFTHERISKEKLDLLKFYGANVIIMDSEEPYASKKNYLNVANEYSKGHGRYFCNQFNNYSNIDAHYKTTAPEIWLQGGQDIDAVVCGVGSGGTLMGIKKYFCERGSRAIFVVADPVGSIFESFFCGNKYSPLPWKIEGIGSNFIPGILSKNAANEVIPVTDELAFSTCNILREKEGIDIGLSSGAIVAAAVKLNSKNNMEKIICLSPDSGERYLSKLQLKGI